VALGALPGPLQPPCLGGLLQQHSPCGQRSGGVLQGPRLTQARHQLSADTERGSVKATDRQ
jgi:hypothetical protein